VPRDLLWPSRLVMVSTSDKDMFNIYIYIYILRVSISYLPIVSPRAIVPVVYTRVILFFVSIVSPQDPRRLFVVVIIIIFNVRTMSIIMRFFSTGSDNVFVRPTGSFVNAGKKTPSRQRNNNNTYSHYTSHSRYDWIWVDDIRSTIIDRPRIIRPYALESNIVTNARYCGGGGSSAKRTRDAPTNFFPAIRTHSGISIKYFRFAFESYLSRCICKSIGCFVFRNVIVLSIASYVGLYHV